MNTDLFQGDNEKLLYFSSGVTTTITSPIISAHLIAKRLHKAHIHPYTYAHLDC